MLAQALGVVMASLVDSGGRQRSFTVDFSQFGTDLRIFINVSGGLKSADCFSACSVAPLVTVSSSYLN